MIGKPKVYEFRWPLPEFPIAQNSIWYRQSGLVLSAACMLSKIWMNQLAKTKVFQDEDFNELVEKRPSNVPLITVANHHSCLDDPVIWGGLLKWKSIFNARKNRWCLTAQDICFTNAFYTKMFSLGKGIPVVRGDGVYQRAMEFALDRLKDGDWVHIYPEAKVNMEKNNTRFKWGVGRLVMDSPQVPIVLPICHIGMDDILPNTKPYRLHLFKTVTIVVGQPIDLKHNIEHWRNMGYSTTNLRKAITDKIEIECHKLFDKTKELHYQRT